MEELILSVLKIILTHLTLLLHHTLPQLELLKLTKTLDNAISKTHHLDVLDNAVLVEVTKRPSLTPKLTSLQEVVFPLLHHNQLIKKPQLLFILHQVLHSHQAVISTLEEEDSLIWLLMVQTYLFQPKELLKESEVLPLHPLLSLEWLLSLTTMLSLKLENL